MLSNKVLVGAFSVIVKTDGSFAALLTILLIAGGRDAGDGAAGLRPGGAGVCLPHPGGAGEEEVRVRRDGE